MDVFILKICISKRTIRMSGPKLHFCSLAVNEDSITCFKPKYLCSNDSLDKNGC